MNPDLPIVRWYYWLDWVLGTWLPWETDHIVWWLTVYLPVWITWAITVWLPWWLNGHALAVALSILLILDILVVRYYFRVWSKLRVEDKQHRAWDEMERVAKEKEEADKVRWAADQERLNAEWRASPQYARQEAEMARKAEQKEIEEHRHQQALRNVRAEKANGVQPEQTFGMNVTPNAEDNTRPEDMITFADLRPFATQLRLLKIALDKFLDGVTPLDDFIAGQIILAAIFTSKPIETLMDHRGMTLSDVGVFFEVGERHVRKWINHEKMMPADKAQVLLAELAGEFLQQALPGKDVESCKETLAMVRGKLASLFSQCPRLPYPFAP